MTPLAPITSLLDLTFKPTEAATVQARQDPAEIRFYGSPTAPGTVSIVAYHGFKFAAGTRLDREQAAALCAGLSAYLLETAPRFTVDADGTATDKETTP